MQVIEKSRRRRRPLWAHQRKSVLCLEGPWRNGWWRTIEQTPHGSSSMLVNRDHVFSLKCAVCSWFKKMLVSMRNYRPAFVESITNVRTTAFKDHAATDTHADAMASLLSKKQQARNTT